MATSGTLLLHQGGIYRKTSASNIMVLNVLDPAQTRYIVRAEELEAFLHNKYEKDHPNYEFNVEVRFIATDSGCCH